MRFINKEIPLNTNNRLHNGEKSLLSFLHKLYDIVLRSVQLLALLNDFDLYNELFIILTNKLYIKYFYVTVIGMCTNNLEKYGRKLSFSEQIFLDQSQFFEKCLDNIPWFALLTFHHNFIIVFLILIYLRFVFIGFLRSTNLTLEYAWITLSTNDTYALGALVLAHSLLNVGTRYPLVVLVTTDVSATMRSHLSLVFQQVKEVDVLDSKDAEHLALLARPELGITFTKLHCWRLLQFEKCVFLDADTLVPKLL